MIQCIYSFISSIVLRMYHEDSQKKYLHIFYYALNVKYARIILQFSCNFRNEKNSCICSRRTWPFVTHIYEPIYRSFPDMEAVSILCPALWPLLRQPISQSISWPSYPYANNPQSARFHSDYSLDYNSTYDGPLRLSNSCLGSIPNRSWLVRVPWFVLH